MRLEELIKIDTEYILNDNLEALEFQKQLQEKYNNIEDLFEFSDIIKVCEFN